MDAARLKSMGWRPKYDLPSGLRHAYDWFVEHVKSGDARLQVA
jgi:GDP-L-fucose synthase